MSNTTLAQIWPHCFAAGLIRIVGRPATSYDTRQFDRDQRMRDLARRAAAYKAKKGRA